VSGAKPRATLPEAEDFLRQRLGPIEGLVALKEGEESQAFGFRSGGTDLVLRINASRHGFEMDRMAAERFAGPDLPVPRVVLIEPLGRWHACVTARAPGVTLQDLRNGESHSYGRVVCDLLESLSICETGWIDGFGPFDPSGKARHQSWPAFLRAIAAHDWRPLPRELRPLLGPLIQYMAERAPSLPERHGLIHGDFGSNNLLVADGAVTGLIDWSEAKAGDPLYDVGNLFFWRPWLDCMEQQCRYILAEAPHLVREEEVVTTYAVHIGLSTAHEAVQAADVNLAEWALLRCQSLVGGGVTA